jgi:hypothetical protein
MSPRLHPAHTRAVPHAPSAIHGLDRTHLAALDAARTGTLVWIDGGWRSSGRFSDGPLFRSAIVNALLRRGLMETSCDNLVITADGVRVRDALARHVAEQDRRLANLKRLRDVLT